VQAQKPVSAAGLALGLVVITGVAVISPFLGLASGVGGILGVIIIAVGLRQAWKQTERDDRLLMGPYELKEGQALG
jgi:cadmium resistance protein CadD (predicted permease)